MLKHIRKTMLTLIMVLALAIPAVSYAADADEETTTIQDYVEAMQPGWNLGNTFDAVGADETAWGNPRVTQTFIEKIAAQGFKSIRIPVTFDQRMAAGPDYTIDEAFLSRLDQAIQWSLDEDMYVMINIHHDSWIWLEQGMHENHDESLARYKAIWTQLADRYKDYSTKVMFESINEPRFWGSDEEKQTYLDELNSSFYDIVRKSGGHNDVRPLVLPTLDTGSEPHKIEALHSFIKELKDPNIIATIHYYGFWPFSVNIAGFTTFNEETKNDIISTFDRAHDNFVADGIPVIIGEFGLLGFDTDLYAIQQGEKLKFFEYMLHYAQEKQLTHMLWDNGQHFGRQSYQWSDQELYDMMNASWSGRSATAETDSIFVKRNAAIKDVDIALQLNGNQLTELKHDNKVLVAGEDYVLNNDVLTLKASLIKELTASKKLGTNAVLTAAFDQGKDWKLFVITYTTPVLKNTSGTTEQFKIPLAYNGDQLATMEAFYADGSIAGPQNWTSFKEFAYTFKPNYNDNTLTLTQNFFNEVNDGTVKLKLHFWSGEKIEYTITKTGDKVNGKAASTSTPGGSTGNGGGGDSSTDPSNGEDTDNGSEGNSGSEEPSTEPEAPVVVSYNDIASHWGYVGIYRATKLGLVNGFEDGSFRPDQAMNRAELAVIIGRALQLPANAAKQSKFADNDTIPAYAKSYVAQLAELGLLNGYTDGTFRPNQSITRAELAVIVARALKLEGSAATSYTDQASIPAWASKEIALLTELDIVTGKADGRFAPQAQTTRAEAVAVIIRVIDHLASVSSAK